MSKAGFPSRFHDSSVAAAVFNVRAYMAKGDGVTDDTAAINYAYSALAAQGYGVLYFPPGIYLVSSTLLIGNAALGGAPSTVSNVTIAGAGARSAYALGLQPPQVSPNVEYSQIRWAPTAATGPNVAVVKLQGAINCFAMSNIEICGSARAGIGLFNLGVNGAEFQSVLVLDCTAAHIWNVSNVGVTTPSNNTWTNVGLVDTVDCGATAGIVCGGLPTDVTVLNSAGVLTGASFHNTWIGVSCWLGRSTGSVGIDLRYMDADAWFGGSIQGDAAAVQISQNPNLTTFPGPAFFFVPDMSCLTPNATFHTRGAFTYAPGFNGSWVYAWGDNGDPLAGLPPWINGFTMQGQTFGPLANVGASMQFLGHFGGSTIANTTAETAFTGLSYALPAGSFIDNTLGSQNGAVMRVKSWGSYTTSGTPALTIRLYMGSVAPGNLLMTTGAIKTVTSPGGQPWRVDTDVIVNGPGSTSAAVPTVTIGASTQVVPTLQSAVGLSAGGSIILTAQWSAASASDAVTLGGFTVELLKSQFFS